jgi:hypothetical protein
VVIITGYGFDISESDYACKFICTYAQCVAGTFAQSVVPRQPSSATQLTCVTPVWPYNARASESAGMTDIILEKGGAVIAYEGASPSGRTFLFTDIWVNIDVTQGFATAASSTITVSGYGFEPASNAYSCIFSGDNLVPIQLRGTPAVVLSSQTLRCPTPLWDAAATTARLNIFKQNCQGSRGVGGACTDANKITLLSGSVEFTFVEAFASLSSASGPASSTSRINVTVSGGGFDPTAASQYALIFQDTSANAIAANGSDIVSMNASSIRFSIPQWGFTPNTATIVSLLRLGSPVNYSTPLPLTYTFQSTWSGYTDAVPLAGGPAGGGERITIVGTGFVTDLGRPNVLAGVIAGNTTDYACNFQGTDGDVYMCVNVYVCVNPCTCCGVYTYKTCKRTCIGMHVMCVLVT